MQVIIFKNDDAGVSVIYPTPESLQLHTIEEVALKDVPAGVEAEIVEISEVLSDRTFRGAWEKNGKAIVHNLTKAKDIAHKKRREARSKEFAPLDVEATIPSRASQAEAARQAIRNKYAAMQEQMDGATTIEELKALLPQE